VLIAQALGVTVEYLISGKKPKKADTPANQPKTKEAVDTISKLNKYNYEIIVSVAKTLLTLQTKNKSRNPNGD
jgi:hypothetical protein